MTYDFELEGIPRRCWQCFGGDGGGSDGGSGGEGGGISDSSDDIDENDVSTAGVAAGQSDAQAGEADTDSAGTGGGSAFDDFTNNFFSFLNSMQVAPTDNPTLNTAINRGLTPSVVTGAQIGAAGLGALDVAFGGHGVQGSEDTSESADAPGGDSGGVGGDSNVLHPDIFADPASSLDPSGDSPGDSSPDAISIINDNLPDTDILTNPIVPEAPGTNPPKLKGPDNNRRRAGFESTIKTSPLGATISPDFINRPGLTRTGSLGG